MASETIVAVFHTLAEAEAVAAELRASGINESAVEVHNQTYTASVHETTLAEPTTKGRTGFWGWLLGEEGYHDEQSMYEDTIAKGGAVVSVIVSDTQADAAYTIIEKHHPADIDERATETTTVAASASNMAAATAGGIPAAMPAPSGVASTGKEGEVIALAEEELQVGKRQVQTGTAKIRRFVVERPVEEQIRLRTETARIERRPVTGGATVGADAFSEKVIEVRETAEEAVVGKTARVVEEVVIGKEATERVETVRDTIRREEIEVVQPESTSPTGAAAIPPKV